MEKTMKDYCPKPSDAIMAMVNGLRNIPKEGVFEIDMLSFGAMDEDSGVCFGCAATCTIQEAANKRFNSWEIEEISTRALIIEISKYDLDSFESCIDALRRGCLQPLLYSYYDVDFDGFPTEYLRLKSMLEILSHENYLERLTPYENLAKYLKSIDL